MKCHFSTDISEELSCCQDGLFDDYGFPINKCPKFPCDKYKELRGSSKTSARPGEKSTEQK